MRSSLKRKHLGNSVAGIEVILAKNNWWGSGIEHVQRSDLMTRGKFDVVAVEQKLAGDSQFAHVQVNNQNIALNTTHKIDWVRK